MNAKRKTSIKLLHLILLGLLCTALAKAQSADQDADDEVEVADEDDAVVESQVAAGEKSSSEDSKKETEPMKLSFSEEVMNKVIKSITNLETAELMQTLRKEIEKAGEGGSSTDALAVSEGDGEVDDATKTNLDISEGSKAPEVSIITQETKNKGRTTRFMFTDIKLKIDDEDIRRSPVEFEYENSEGSGGAAYKAAMDLLNEGGDETAAYENLMEAADLGHWRAKREVGWALVLGRHLSQDLLRARGLFEELAERGDAEGHMGLGFLHATGLAANTSQARALLHYTLAASGPSEWAHMALGYRYLEGVAVQASCEDALVYYKMVANSVSENVKLTGSRAVQRIRLSEEADSPSGNSLINGDLIQYYQFMADKGDVISAMGLGSLYYQGGRGVAPDHTQALLYFKQAAEAGHANAMAFLGNMYMDGSGGLRPDNATAFGYYKQAADAKNPVGYNGLGLMYLHGRHVPQDLKQARHYFTESAKAGWVDGQLNLGNLYYYGQGVPKDPRKAFEYYTLASQNGHVLAYYKLAQMQNAGLGTFRSCQFSTELFKNVAERGSWGELLTYAYRAYWDGHHSSALVAYMLLGELGYEAAQTNAAFILDRHGPFPALFADGEMHVRALAAWGRAAGQGQAAARVAVGDHHYYGRGTAQDHDAAAAHYRVAQETHRSAQAAFNLGYMHEHGLGLSQDLHLAKRFYDQARESDADAAVPVALALAKLSAANLLTSLSQLGKPAALGAYDLHLLLLMAVLVGALLVARRR